MKRDFLQNIRLGDQALPKEVIDAIMAENGKDIELAKGAASTWEEKYNQAISDHSQALAQLRMEHALERAVTKAGGRNAKAISALLDMEAIAQSDDIPAALEQAVEQLKQSDAYLFAGTSAPPYAAGTGTAAPGQYPATLAGALREKFAGSTR